MSQRRMAAAMKASSIHLAITGVIASMAAAIVFWMWFPYPYRELIGGQRLFWILVGVDITCGPLLTAALFDPQKSRKELLLDIGLIAAIQIAALTYGMYSISEARPVALVFEVDRFVAVSKAQIDPEDLKKAAPEFRKFTLNSKPLLLGIRPAKDGNEALDSLEHSLQGSEPSVRPGWWQPFEQSRAVVRSRMKPLAALRANLDSADRVTVDAAAAQTKFAINYLSYLPLTSRKSLDQWIVLLDSKAEIVGYAPINGFQ